MRKSPVRSLGSELQLLGFYSSSFMDGKDNWFSTSDTEKSIKSINLQNDQEKVK